MSDITLKEIKEIYRKADAYDELKEWLEKQRIRNSEWENFVQKDTRLGIPIGYLLDKMNDLVGELDER